MSKPKHVNIKEFMKRVEKTDTCWLWVAGKNGDGYGNWSLDGQSINAHRASYVLFVGEILDGLSVLHTCDNPSCVNPDHLWLGTYKDNAQDRAKKGRNNSRRGENHGRSKLTDNQVREIKRLYQDGLKLNEIASMFGVSYSHTYAIGTNRARRQ
jgi:hypothetical protein